MKVKGERERERERERENGYVILRDFWSIIGKQIAVYLRLHDHGHGA